MRVLHICTENPARVLGGMGMHVQKLLPQLDSFCDVHLLTLPLDDNEEIPVAHIYPKHVSYGLHSDEDYSGAMQANARSLSLAGFEAFAEYDFDLIHAHDWSAIQTAFDLRQSFGVPVVTTWHLFQSQIMQVENLQDDYRVDNAICYEVSGWQGSDEVIVCSKAMAEMGADYYGKRDVNIIPNGVDVDEFRHAKERAELPRDKPVVMFLGRWTGQKGVQFILDAVEMSDAYRFVCIGPWQEHTGKGSELSQRAQRLAKKYPERLSLLGEMHGYSRIPYMLSADFGIVPSIAEPFGIVALEWMAAGIPLITTQVDGLGEFCDDTNSIWMAQSGEGLLDALRTRITHRMLDNALATAEGFRWRNIAWHTHNLYEEVIHEQNQVERTGSH